MPRDRVPFLGRESREAQAAAQKRAAQQERIARAKDAIKDVFRKKRLDEEGAELPDVWDGDAPRK